MRLGTYYRSQLLKQLNIRADAGKVLDVGCYDAYWLSTQSAERKIALDINIVAKNRSIKYIRGPAIDSKKLKVDRGDYLAINSKN